MDNYIYLCITYNDIGDITPKIQLELTEEQSKKLALYIILKNLPTKAAAIQNLIDNLKIDVKISR
jgi:hypothetical protein